MYRLIIRPFLFSLDPERAHHLVVNLLRVLFRIPGMESILRSIFCKPSHGLQRELMGLKFPNPVGLAAGFDKDATLFRELSAFGFGFIEVGTVTPKAQEGNPKPRMFRLPEDKALINRMGFNNDGVSAMAERLKRRRPGFIIGGNIGKNKITVNDRAIEDYEICFNALFNYVDYFTVNVSSPNTPGLRELQDRAPLTRLLNHLMLLNRKAQTPKPVLLKIAPDLSESQLDEIVSIIKETGLSGIIATNTTVSREGLNSSPDLTAETGGLSGLPLKDRSTEVIRYIRQKAGPELVIIGAGGIFTAADVREKLQAGANLVQVYTGFVYEGPGMVKSILDELGDLYK